MPKIVRRQAVRAAIFDSQGRILLMQAQDPASRRRVWFTPGGGLKSGETPAEAMRRELLEETGHDSFEIGPEIWTRRESFNWDGRVLDQTETFFLVTSGDFTPVMTVAELYEFTQFRGFHWWSVEELETTAEMYYPRRLPELIRQLASEGPPASPFDAGV